MPVSNDLVLGGAKLIYKNFSGKQGKYNPAGNRNFCVIIPDPDLVNKLIEDGWNVKALPPRDPEDAPVHYIKVNVKYGDYPPKIVLITSRGKTKLNEDEINVLDWAEIENADIIIRAYPWNTNGKTGISGYLKNLYVKIHEDPFELKYADIPDAPDSAQNSITDNSGDYQF